MKTIEKPFQHCWKGFYFYAMIDSAIKSAIEQAHEILIIAHKAPDGDAIGASVGWARTLKGLNKSVQVMLPDPAASNICWMEDSKDFVIADQDEDRAKKAIERAELIFCLDFNAYHRAGKFVEEQLKTADQPIMMIDHHPYPEESQFEAMHSVVKACSTAELIAQIIYEWGWEQYLDLTAMEALYMGIVTDSGSFRYPSVSDLTHEMVAKMIRSGLEPYVVHERIFDNNALHQVKLKAYTISEKLEVNDTLAIMSLTLKEMNRFQYKKGDTEGLVNTGLSITGVKMSVFFKEKTDGGVKISFRSKGDVYVNQLAADHFDGGGHQYAAGGFFEGNIQDAVALLKEKYSAYV